MATDGFEQSELTEPRKALDAAGAKTDVISPKKGKIRGSNHKEWGQEVAVDQVLDRVSPNSYDALVLPGGVMNADSLGSAYSHGGAYARQGISNCTKR